MINKSNAELCASLNFSFDEANELFCEESLNSMQCAKVNGGSALAWITVFMPLIAWGVQELVRVIVQAIENHKNATAKPTGPTPPSNLYNAVFVNNSMKLIYSNGSSEIYYDWELFPTEAGTLA